MDKEQALRERFELLKKTLNERALRLFAATEALAFGHGGTAAVARVTGLAPSTIWAGRKELRALEDGVRPTGKERIRRPGGGRKQATEKDATLQADLERLVEPTTRGDPESPLRWTCKSLRHLAEELRKQGHRVGKDVVARLLHRMDYNLQANRKTKEGGDHPDRDAQFQHINEQVKRELAAGNPVISIDAKKKELVGDFKNAGREYRPKGRPEEVRVYDFVTEQGRVTPYGVLDIANNKAWVSVGIDHDTATFAVEAIRRWWHSMGEASFPEARTLLITADGGGSNGSRVRLWKIELQSLANELGFPISVCHFPPGTSKWNKIEHRLFSFITKNWRGRPLITHEVIVNLISATTTKTGLKVIAALDENIYPKGRKVSDKELARVNLRPNDFHGEWNYTIHPARAA